MLWAPRKGGCCVGAVREEKYGGMMEEVRTRVPGVGTYPVVINNIINNDTVTIIILTVILLWITGGNSSVPW